MEDYQIKTRVSLKSIDCFRQGPWGQVLTFHLSDFSDKAEAFPFFQYMVVP